MGGLGIFWMTRVRFAAEKLHTANALKANDEVHARLKAAVSDLTDAQLKADQLEGNTRALSKQIDELETQNKALLEELDKLKKKAPKK